MKPYRWLVSLVLTLSLLLLSLTVVSVQAQAHEDHPLDEETKLLINDVRAATAKFRDVDTGLDAGYGKFLECFRYGDESGMGQHYVSGDLAGDDVVDPMKPEALVYEPLDDGTMILVAFEYLVFADVWDPNNSGREAPTLFGQEFHLKTNIPDTPPVWTLHIWLWTHNPDGLFADFNPIVFCPQDAPSVDMSKA
jgi:hypothetical protein